MNKYKTFIITIFIATHTSVFAQLNPVWNVQSPEVANLGTYGQIPVSQFTGVPNISIPVYNIKVGQYSFPLSISYHLASVKPQNQGGCLGLGWNLMAGGYIARTVRGGIYDEQCDANGKAHGYYAFAKRLKNMDEKNLNKENDSLFLGDDIKRNFHEISADEFSFSFFGYSGNFYYNPDGGWTVVSDQDIKVEFDENDGFIYLDQIGRRINCKGWGCADWNNRFFCKFTLITPDGCRYEFGGLDAMEFSVPYYGRYSADLTATTWKLSKITTPDNRAIEFAYNDSALLCNINYDPQVKRLDNTNCGNVTSINNGRAGFTGFLQFPATLKSIKTPNENISFVYNNDYGYAYRFYKDALFWTDASMVERFSIFSTQRTSDSFGLFLPNQNVQNVDDVRKQLKNYLLHCIQIDKGIGSRTFYFDYGLDNRKKLSLFTVREGIPELKTVYKKNVDTQELFPYYEIPTYEKGNDMPEYKFHYNTGTKLPMVYDLGDTDSWGYYNGKNVSISDAPQEKVILPNYSATMAEVLTELVYPTGGKTCLEYEQNSYSKKPSQNLSKLENQPGNAGGLRISKITNKHADNSIESVKRYYYSEDKKHPENSSGIVTREIKVSELYKLTEGTLGLYSKSGISAPTTLQNSPYVGYSTVIEETLDGNENSLGYTKYRFSNYEQNKQGYLHFDEKPDMFFNTENIGVATPLTSNSEERGKLLSKEVYDNSGKLVSKTEYKYQRVKEQSIPTVSQRCIPICSNQQLNPYIYILGWKTNTYLYSYLPTEERQTDYLHADSIVTTKTLSYDDYKQLTCTTQQTGSMPVRTTMLTYPYNYYNYAWMKELHVLSPVIENTVSENNYSKTDKYKYSQIGNIPYISQYTTVYNGNKEKENYTVNKVDSYGNPIEIESNGMKTCFVWGNMGQTLMAKIENTSYENAKYQMGCNNDQYISIDYLIANRHKLPSAQIYIYRYDNTLRLISITNPSGMTEYYAYDGLDRLRKEYYLDNTEGKNEHRTKKKYGYGYNNGN